MNAEQAMMLRAAFPASAIGKLPRAGTTLDYVGHAAVTDRLLAVDAGWNWEPVAWAGDGTPYWQLNGDDAILWIRLTVCDVTRLGVGIVKAKAFELEKQLISDALRNAAMRFGVALDLWSKENLEDAGRAEPLPGNAPAAGDGGEAASRPTPASPPCADDRGNIPPVSKRRRDKAKTRAVALQADGVKVADEREAAGLPLIDSADNKQMHAWEELLTFLEQQLAAPFEDAKS